MIDLLQRLPDSAIGLLVAGSIWFGFNYAVLGERAMEHYATTEAVPACMAHLEASEEKSPRRSTIGQAFDMPELDQLTNLFIDQLTPASLTKVQKMAMCECAVIGASATMRFDYAVHTASFRIINPDSFGQLRREAASFITSGACGASSN